LDLSLENHVKHIVTYGQAGGTIKNQINPKVPPFLGSYFPDFKALTLTNGVLVLG